jgi:serine/threonine protein kinase
MSSASGQLRLGKYRVLEHIAAGGMAAVYKAVDETTGAVVALKVLPPALAERDIALERFRQEATVGIRLRHEHIVALYEITHSQDTHFLVMEFVEGITLQQHIDQHGPLEPGLARTILLQIVSALDHAHQAGVIHRDIKPSNILLTDVDGKTVAKLADLGLSRETTDDDQFRLTREGHTVGTVDYMSPEQARDSRAADIRSDIYSLGCTLFHMLAGKPPFAEGTLTERLMRHATVEAPELGMMRPGIPADLAAICRRMLAKRPEQRQQTPAELWLALSREGTAAAEAGPTVVIPSTARKSGDAASEAIAGSSEMPQLELVDDPGWSTPEQRHRAGGQFEMGRKFLAARETPQGLEAFRAAIRLVPTNISYRGCLRELTRATKRNVRPVRLSPVKALYFRTLLGAARMAKRHERVLDYGEQVLINRPKDVDVHLAMAEAAAALGWTKLAWWLLQQAQQVEDTTPVHRAIAQFLEQQQDFSGAIRFWELVERAGDHHVRGHIQNLAARETIARGNLDERVGDLEAQLKEPP